MSRISLLCRTATTFARSGELDEDALGGFLERFVDADLGIYLASGASGEGHALTREELFRVYRVGVEVCKGRIPVNANQPEQHTARASLELALLAVEAGIDVINVYGPAGWHGFRASDEEYIAYFSTILAELRHPVALCPNPILGYPVSPDVVVRICKKHAQVVAVNLSGISGDRYFLKLREQLQPKVAVYVHYPSSLHTLSLGASGLLAAEANVIPKTFRSYMDLYDAGRYDELNRVYADLSRFTQFVEQWNSASPRWLKMAMKVLHIPGGDGGLREPYLMPSEAELERFTAGLLALQLPEINDMARAAGLVS